MLHADLSDTPLASHWPDIAGACDSLADVLREALAMYIPAQHWPAAFARLDAVLAGQREVPVPTQDRAEIIAEVLLLISSEGTEQIHARAAALNKQLGNDGRSDAAIGRNYGLTRAAINSYRRGQETETGVKSRSSKSEEHRETCRRNRFGRRKAAPAAGVLQESNPFSRAYRALFT